MSFEFVFETRHTVCITNRLGGFELLQAAGRPATVENVLWLSVTESCDDHTLRRRLGVDMRDTVTGLGGALVDLETYICDASLTLSVPHFF